MEKKLSGYSILVIEDDRSIRESLVELLEVSGFKVLTANNGKKGLECINRLIPDLVLTDIMMPEMDGFEVLKNIRSNPKTELLPVIMLTAKVDLNSKLHGLGLAANDYITKPFQFKELHLKISNLLNTRNKLLYQSNASFDTNTITSGDQIFLKKLRLLLDQNIDQPKLQVDFLAEHLCMSPSTLQRKVKKITGKPTVQVVKEYKLRRAQEMVISGYGTLSEIAFKSGFNSLAYFSSCYKDFFGKSPKKDLPKNIPPLSLQ